MKKKVLFAAAFMLATVGAYAQGNGIAGITEATNMVTSYFDPGTKLIYAVGAVVGLIGGVKVYSKFSSGDPDTSKTAASWFRCLYFPDCSRHHLTFILPLIWRSIKSTKGLVVAPSSRGYAANTSSSSPEGCLPCLSPLWCCIWWA